MNFADEMRRAGTFTKTENGAVALNSTGDACLDLFSTIGSLRQADDDRIYTLFEEAFAENPLFAVKIVFYARDIRNGLGERSVFRKLIRYMAENHQEALINNLALIGVFGRYDDLYSLIGTPLEENMWQVMKAQFEEDFANLNAGNEVSLLAKWIKTADASSDSTRKLGILTAHKLGFSVYDFKRIVRRMRKHINVVEGLMSENRWADITYSKVPGRSMLIYRDAFMRHDAERYSEFVGNALEGKQKIHSATLYPYDIVEKILFYDNADSSLEAQWRQLPDYVEKGTNAVVMADVSGSMYGRPMATSIGLAIYFAERNVGAYHNMFMTFSSSPKIELLKGATLAQKVKNMSKADWGMRTDLKRAFDKVLEIAVKGNVSPAEMPKSIIVVSDMEIDYCGNHSWSFYDKMKERFEKYGYKIPNIVFWNVNSRNNVFHADSARKGVQLCSGQSAAVFKQLLGAVGMTPVEYMESVINKERYNCITIA